MQYAIVVIASLISGLIGVLVSITYYRKYGRYMMKIDTFRTLIGYRFDIRGEHFTKAVNEIFIVFQDSKGVIEALNKFHDIIISKQVTLADDSLLMLFKAICEDLKIDSSKYSESLFMKPFNIKDYEKWHN